MSETDETQPTRLERLLEVLSDTSDMTDAEVRAELAERGIDLSAAQARFDAFLDAEFAKRAQRQAQKETDDGRR